jgi:hypothetical protein
MEWRVIHPCLKEGRKEVREEGVFSILHFFDTNPLEKITSHRIMMETRGTQKRDRQTKSNPNHWGQQAYE